MSAESMPAGQGRPIRVGIVDEHVLFAMGVEHVLATDSTFSVAWIAAEIQAVGSRLAERSVDLLVVGLHPRARTDGLNLIRSIRSQDPRIPIVALSPLGGRHWSDAALRAGADLILPKNVGPDELLSALDSVFRSRGGTHAAGRPARAASGLSPREVEVLEQLTTGRTSDEIAHRLGISTATVNKHVHAILVKLGARNRAEAVAIMTAEP